MSIACPKCKSYMFPSRNRSVSIDSCTGCEGLWLDVGELGQLAETRQDFPEKANPTATTLRCPRCANALSSRPYSSSEPVELECCARCKGVYLDKGELNKIQEIAAKVRDGFPTAYRESMARKAEWKEGMSAVYKTGNPAAKSALVDRNTFVRNVYLLLAATLLVTALGAFYGMAVHLGERGFQLAIGGELVAFVICLFVRRLPVWNLIALFAYTGFTGLSFSVLFQSLVEAGMGDLIWQAALITAAVFGSLSVYVHLTGQDFSWMGGLLFVSLTGLVMAALFNLFLPLPLGIGWTYLSILTFSGYILYDTSNILTKYETDEVVSAVLDLYLDIINLFLDILRVLSYLKRN